MLRTSSRKKKLIIISIFVVIAVIAVCLIIFRVPIFGPSLTLIRNNSAAQAFRNFAYSKRDNFGAVIPPSKPHFIPSSSRSVAQTPTFAEIRRSWKDNKLATIGIDWSSKDLNWHGAQYTCINNQGGCGDCWANSVTECMTIRLSIRTGYYAPLDINQLLLCPSAEDRKKYSLFSCNGGWPLNAMYYLQDHALTGPQCNAQEMDCQSMPGCCVPGTLDKPNLSSMSCKEQTLQSYSRQMQQHCDKKYAQLDFKSSAACWIWQMQNLKVVQFF